MAQVPTGIISALLHPAYGQLSRETLLAGPLSAGVTQIQRIRGPVNVDAFGLSFSFFTVPAAFGWEQRVHKDYELPIVEFAPFYTLFDGHTMYGPSEVLYHEGDIFYFDQLFPTRVDVWVQTGCVVIAYWVTAF